jgi:hypothetical protein
MSGRLTTAAHPAVSLSEQLRDATSDALGVHGRQGDEYV